VAVPSEKQNGELGFRPQLTATFARSRVPAWGVRISLCFAFLALFVPTPQMSWVAKGVVLFLGAFSAWEFRHLARNDIESVRVMPDDAVQLRRRYEKSDFGDFQSVTLQVPLFVSPWVIAFQTQEMGKVVLFADQLDAREWRELRVRLNHLRFGADQSGL
jgi:hypothetical protein